MITTSNSDASSKQVITSLLTEHFRYSPLTVLDDIINTVNELVCRAVNAVEAGLNAAPATSLGFSATTAANQDGADEGGNSEARAEIEIGVHQLETLLEASIDKNFDKLEIYVLRNILTVPQELAPYMRLRHYEGLDFTTDSSSMTPEDLHLTRKKLHETRKLHEALQAEKTRHAAVIAQLQSLVHGTSQSLSFLAHQVTDDKDTSAQLSEAVSAQTTSSILAQLPALKDMLISLRATTDSETLLVVPTSRQADVRRDYVDTQTRRVMQGQGMDVVNIGAGGAGLGSKIGREEAQAMETILERLSSSNA